MADVYYRVSGAADRDLHLLRAGLGNLRFHSAMRSSILPFLAVTGNVPTSQFNRGGVPGTVPALYQADLPSTVRSYCQKVFQPTRGEMVPLAVRQAWKTMTTGRRGRWC